MILEELRRLRRANTVKKKRFVTIRRSAQQFDLRFLQSTRGGEHFGKRSIRPPVLRRRGDRDFNGASLHSDNASAFGPRLRAD
jgi:hypothetical protein